MKTDMQKYNKLVKQVESLFETDGDMAAFAFLDDCIEKNPDFLEACIARSDMHAEIGLKHSDPVFIREAFRDLESVIEKAPNDPEAYYHRGLLCARLGDNIDKAFADFSKAIELDANHANAYANRATIYLKRKELQNAIGDCNKAIELSPDIVEAYFNRGTAYNNMDMHSKALPDFNKVIELAPENAEAYVRRGYVYSQAGNIQEAIKDYEKFLELDPNNQKASMVRDELEKFKSGTASSDKSGCCYVATAVYGSCDAPEVLCLRRFRDETLAHSIFGRMFISLYYRFSPPFAEWLKDARHINKIVRKILDMFVARVSRKLIFPHSGQWNRPFSVFSPALCRGEHHQRFRNKRR